MSNIPLEAFPEDSDLYVDVTVKVIYATSKTDGIIDISKLCDGGTLTVVVTDSDDDYVEVTKPCIVDINKKTNDVSWTTPRTVMLTASE